jgi:hypothetical protein
MNIMNNVNIIYLNYSIMEKIKQFINHKLDEKYMDIYEHVYFGVNLFNINYVRQNIKSNKRYLIVFEDDFVEFIQPTMVLNNPISLNILLLKNYFSVIDRDEFNKAVSLINGTYDYFSQKYFFLKERDYFIKYKNTYFPSKIFLTSYFNLSNYFYNLKMNFWKFDETYLHTTVTNNINLNSVIMQELFELTKLNEKIKLLNYQEFKDQKSQGNYFSIELHNKLTKNMAIYLTGGYTIFNNTAKVETHINFKNKKTFMNDSNEIILKDNNGTFSNIFLNGLIPITQNIRLSHTDIKSKEVDNYDTNLNNDFWTASILIFN